MEASPPQDLVDEEVPQSGDHRLVHERRFEGCAPGANPLLQLASRQPQGVRPVTPHGVLHVLVPLRQPDPLQLSLVTVAELTLVEADDHTVVPVAVVRRRAPRQLSCHPEVEQ
jgi:hypothetical protein